MQINDVRPDSGLLILTSHRGEKLPLEVGVPFLAEVLEQDGERTLLSLAGRLLRCTADLPLQPGTSVWLNVREASPQRVVLALFDPKPGTSPSGQAGEASPSGTAPLLAPPALPGQPGESAQPGLPALPDLPFSTSTPAPAAAGSETLAKAVSFLLSNGRPTTQVAVEAVVQLLAHEPNLAQTLTSLEQLLSAPQPGLPAGPAESGSSLAGLPAPLVEQVRQALANAFFAPVPAGETTAPADGAPADRTPALFGQATALEAVIRQLGLDHETRVGAFVLAEALADEAASPAITAPPAATPGDTFAQPPTPPAMQPPAPSAPQPPPTLASPALLIRLVAEVLTEAPIRAELIAQEPPVVTGEPGREAFPESTAAAADPSGRETAQAQTQAQAPAQAPAPPPAFPLERDLKGLLLLLRRALTGRTHDQPGELPASAATSPGPDAATETAAAQQRLVRAVDDALQNLTGQRLAAPVAKGDDQLQLYLQIPVTVGDQRHTAELRVFREPRGRGKAHPDRPAALSVSCRLTTAHLGPVRVDLALRPKGSSEAHLYLATAPVADLFRRHEEEFREILSAAGFRLGRVAYSLVPPPVPPGPTEPAGPTAHLRGGVDLRL